MTATTIDAADLERLRAALLQADAAELAALRAATDDARQCLQSYRHLVAAHAAEDLAGWDVIADRLAAAERRRVAAEAARQAWRAELHRTLGREGDRP